MTSSKESIISLIARQELDLNKGPFCRTIDSLKGADSELCDLKKHVYSIKLPDQNHTYHILDNYLERSDGVYVTKIPFTHPTSIPSILKVLRQQALFNFVLGSCIRRNKSTSAGQNVTSNNIEENPAAQMPNIFDVLPVSLNSICVAFEHPSRESLATLELDCKEISCQLYALDRESVCSDEFATKVLQKCWSIPVTLRSVLKKCNERRLALLEDTNKRRERELQELLSNNSSTQQGLQIKPNLKYRETTPQSKFIASNEKSNARDLNSIAEFLTSKKNNANLSDNHRQNDTNSDSVSNRTNLMKKFSCKPKVKQNIAMKSTIGNKILSQMLKRQNSTIVLDDPIMRGPSTKKAKTKNTSGESTSAESNNAPPTLTATKLISPEVANAARLTNKLAKQAGKSQNVSLSLIRAPSNKTQASAISSTTISPSQVGLTLAASQKQPDSSIQKKIKSQINGTGSPAEIEGARKTSINAIIDQICLGVNDDGKNDSESQQQGLGDQVISTNSDTNRNADSQKVAPNGAKTKSRIPGGDQFAIKQGSSSGGLKLTVTKTKPPSFTIQPSSSSNSNTTTTSSTSASPSFVLKSSSTNSNNLTTASPSTPTATPATTSLSTHTTSTNASSASTINNNSKQSETTKIVDSGSAAPSIRYTIPKISKTQHASQSSSSNANSSDNSTTTTTNDSNQPADDSNNPSSSGNPSAAPSSTTAKRTTSNPFNRNGNSNRNPVSSSTHPPNRTTSNPLVNAISRPSSTSNNDNHLLNRISSSSGGNGNNTSGQLGIASGGNPRQIPRSVNLMPQPRIQMQQSQSVINQTQFNVAPRFLTSGLMPPQGHSSLPLIGQPLPPQMFTLRMPQQTSVFSTQNDLNLIAANQVALLNQQHQQQQQQQQQIPHQPIANHLQHIQQQPQVSVSSSSDNGNEERKLISNSQAATSSSTPSSPTECDQAETNAPPPLIPIDSVHEVARPASPDEEHDDASDRLSIVDMVEFADANSLVDTPKSSDISSPMDVAPDANSEISSPSKLAQSSADAAASTSEPSILAPTVAPSEVAPASSQQNEIVYSSCESATAIEVQAQVAPDQTENRSSTQPDMMITTQSPQSTVVATTQNE